MSDNERYPAFLNPSKPSKVQPRPYLTADIESKDWKTVDILGVFDGHSYRGFARADYFVRWLLKQRGIDIYIHYGGGFDFWFIMPELIRTTINIELMRSKNRLSVINIRSINCRIIDSYSIMPAPLRTICEKYDLKTKVGERYMHVDNWHDISNRELKRRNRIDCELLYQVVDIFKQFTKEVKASPNTTTIGAAAIKSFTQWLPRRLRTQFEYRDYVHNAYYGGRVEVFRTNAKHCLWYDLVSAYAWAMKQYVPVNKGINLKGTLISLDMLKREDLILFVHCSVKLPDWLPVGLLPVRIQDGSRDGGYRVEYPSQRTVQGIWASPELRTALGLGAKIVKIHDAVAYQALPLLKGWVDKHWHVRQQWPIVGKQFINALYGKFAQGLESETVYLNPTDDRIVKNSMTPMISADDNIWVYKHFSKVPSKLLPVAATLTSYVRAKMAHMLANLYSWGYELIYCDTDSIVYVGDELTNDVGFESGDWRLEGHVNEWKCIQSRWYLADILTVTNEKHFKIASAGMGHLSIEDFKALVSGKSVDKQRLIDFHSQFQAVMDEKLGYPRYTNVSLHIDKILKKRLKVEPQSVTEIERSYYPYSPEL